MSEARSLSRLFKALGDETRMQIVALLSHGELCVCHLEAALRLSQPNASRHLAVLKSAGVVEARRAGNWIYYRIADQADAACQRQLHSVVHESRRDGALKKEIARVLKKTGPGACT